MIWLSRNFCLRANHQVQKEKDFVWLIYYFHNTICFGGLSAQTICLPYFTFLFPLIPWNSYVPGLIFEIHFRCVWRISRYLSPSTRHWNNIKQLQLSQHLTLTSSTISPFPQSTFKSKVKVNRLLLTRAMWKVKRIIYLNYESTFTLITNLNVCSVKVNSLFTFFWK